MTGDDPNESNSGQFTWFFNHLPSIIWQRRMYVAVPTVVMTLAALIAAFILPTIYRSSATLLIQAQDLPTDLIQAPTSGDIEQRIARIRERVLSRGDLISLIEQNDLYPTERRGKPMSTIIKAMRESTTVGALSNDIGQTAGSGTVIAINMAFDYPDPAKAQAVLQSFVNSFLKMDNENVEDKAKLSVRFLEDQAKSLQQQISQIEGQLTQLKARNGAALANAGAPMMVDTGSYSAQITALENQNRQLLLEAQRGPRTGELAAAQAALAAATARYNDTHPDVIAARERVAALRNAPRENDGDAIRAQIAANNSAISSLTEVRNSALSRAQLSSAGQARAPAILEQAMQLESRASALREQYNSVATNLLKAQNSERMASEQLAERLTLVEPPSLPDRPHKPNRPFLVAAGAAVGLGLGLLLALLIELLSQPLRSPAQIEALGFPLLGVVPLLNQQRRKGTAFAFGRRRKLLSR